MDRRNVEGRCVGRVDKGATLLSPGEIAEDVDNGEDEGDDGEGVEDGIFGGLCPRHAGAIGAGTSTVGARIALPPSTIAAATAAAPPSRRASTIGGGNSSAARLSLLKMDFGLL